MSAKKRELTVEPSFGENDLSYDSNVIAEADAMGLFGNVKSSVSPNTAPASAPVSPCKRPITLTPNANASIRRVADQREQTMFSLTPPVEGNAISASTSSVSRTPPQITAPVTPVQHPNAHSPSPGPFGTGYATSALPQVTASSISPAPPPPIATSSVTSAHLAYAHSPSPGPFGTSAGSVGMGYTGGGVVTGGGFVTENPAFALGNQGLLAPNLPSIRGHATLAPGSSYHPQRVQPYPSYQLPQTIHQPHLPATTASMSVPLPAVPTSPAPTVQTHPASTIEAPSASMAGASSVSTADPPSAMTEHAPSALTADTPSASTALPPNAKGTNKTGKANAGRPSKDTLAKVDEFCESLERTIDNEAKTLGVETSLIFNRLGLSLKGQRSPSPWNRYQSYCLSIDNIDEEMARLKDHATLSYDGNFPPSKAQVGEAYDAFMRYHGKEDGKRLLEAWSEVQELQTVSRKVERNRAFMSSVSQAFNLASHLRNKGIYMWSIIAGGNVGTDQRLVKIVSVPENEKFLESGFLVEPEAFPGLYQAVVFDGTSLTYTKHQIANKANELGLTVSGPGLDAPEAPKASRSRPASKAQAPKKKEDTASSLADNLRTIVLALALKQVGGFKKKNNLPWATMAAEQVELGIQVLGYPLKTEYPWKLLDLPSEQRSRGIRNMSMDDQNRLLMACSEDQPVPLSFAKVEPIRLTENEVPILETVPDENGKVTRLYYRDLPFLHVRNVVKEKRVKFEVDDDRATVAAAATPTLKRSSRQQSARPTSKHDGEEEEDQLTSDFTDEEDEPTPQPKKQAAKAKAQPKTSKKPKSVALLPSDVDDESDDLKDRATPSPAPIQSNKAKKAAAKSTEASSSKGTVNKKAPISAAEFEQGDFRPMEMDKSPKRPAENAYDTASKRARHEAPKPPVQGEPSTSISAPSSSISTSAANIQLPQGTLHPILPPAQAHIPLAVVPPQSLQPQNLGSLHVQPAVVHAQPQALHHPPPTTAAMQMQMQPLQPQAPHHPPPSTAGGGIQMVFTPDQHAMITQLQQSQMTQIAQLQQQFAMFSPQQQDQILDPIRQANATQLQQLVCSFLGPPPQGQLPPGSSGQ